MKNVDTPAGERRLSSVLRGLVASGDAIQVGFSGILVLFGKFAGEWRRDRSGWRSRGFVQSRLRSPFFGLRLSPEHQRRSPERKVWRRATGRLAWEFGEHLQTLAVQTGLPYTIIEALFLLTGTRMFQAYQAHPARFVENFGGLTALNLLSMPYQLRWRLVMLCYKMPWKKAVRRIWPRTHPQLLNDLTWTKIGNRTTKVIRWGQEAGSLEGHKMWGEARGFGHITKEKWLIYYQKHAHQSNSLINYWRELSGARAEGITLPDWPGLVVDPAEASRRHDEIIRLARARNIANSKENPTTTSQHQQNWEGFGFQSGAESGNGLPDGWRPLLTYQDFDQEGQEQHHCVGSYYGKTSSLYCHLEMPSGASAPELDGETATLMWSIDASGVHKIVQLYGVCNAPVSDKMMEWVRQCLGKICRDALPTKEPVVGWRV